MKYLKPPVGKIFFTIRWRYSKDGKLSGHKYVRVKRATQDELDRSIIYETSVDVWVSVYEAMGHGRKGERRK